MQSLFLDCDKRYRLLCAIRARRRALEVQHDFWLKACPVDDMVDGTRSVERWREARYEATQAVLEDMEDQLDRYSVILPSSYEAVRRAFKALPANVEAHSLVLFGQYVPRKRCGDDPMQDAIYYAVRRGTRKGRQSDLEWRLWQEMEYRYQQGWYVIFNTLTVRPKEYLSLIHISEPTRPY